jgi:hypothetical protein
MLLPRCYFDRETCARGLDALTQYHKKWDADRQVFTNTPEHDWASHGADAFRTGALGFRATHRQDLLVQAVTDFDPLTYDRPTRHEALRDFDPFAY